MSYDTFHKIKQLENGDFLVTTKCSNDGARPHEWTMDYFRVNFPGLNNEQLEAAFILYTEYSGDHYYPEKYKRLAQLAADYGKRFYTEKGEYPAQFINAPMSRERYEKDVEEFRNNPKYASRAIQGKLERTYAQYVIDTNRELLEAINGFIAYKREQVIEPKIKAKIRLSTGYYVSKLTANSRQIKLVEDEQDAHIFNMPRTELEKLMKRIPARLEPQIIYIQKGRTA